MRLQTTIGAAFSAVNSYEMYYKDCSERARMRELYYIQRQILESLELLQDEIDKVKQLEEADL